jgi:hypothetical protein
MSTQRTMACSTVPAIRCAALAGTTCSRTSFFAPAQRSNTIDRHSAEPTAAATSHCRQWHARERARARVCVLCVACGTWVRVSERVYICVASIHSLWLRGGTGCTSDPTGVTKPRTQRIAVHPIDSARMIESAK